MCAGVEAAGRTRPLKYTEYNQGSDEVRKWMERIERGEEDRDLVTLEDVARGWEWPTVVAITRKVIQGEGVNIGMRAQAVLVRGNEIGIVAAHNTPIKVTKTFQKVTNICDK